MSVSAKLQAKSGRTLAVENLPGDFPAALFADAPRAECGKADVVLLFAADRAALDALLPKILTAARKEAILWIGYPKLTSKKAGDLNRDVIRNLMPGFGADVVSQIALDGDWSALRMKRLFDGAAYP